MEAGVTHEGNSAEDGRRSRPCPREDPACSGAKPGRTPRKASALLAACGDGSLAGWGERRMAGLLNWWIKGRGTPAGAGREESLSRAASSCPAVDGGESHRPYSLAPRRIPAQKRRAPGVMADPGTGRGLALGAPGALAALASTSGSRGIHATHSRPSGRPVAPLRLAILLISIAFAFLAPVDAQVPPFRRSNLLTTSHPGTTSPQPRLTSGCRCGGRFPTAVPSRLSMHPRCLTGLRRGLTELVSKGPFVLGSCPDRATSP